MGEDEGAKTEQVRAEPKVRAKMKAQDVTKTLASRDEDASQGESAVQTETVEVEH